MRLPLAAVILTITGLFFNTITSAKEATAVQIESYHLGSEAIGFNGRIDACLSPFEYAETTPELSSKTGSRPDGTLRSLVRAQAKDTEPQEVKKRAEEEITTEPPSGSAKRHDPELMISTQSVLKKQKTKEEIVLIDVRDRDAFDKFRIPGSISIPLYAIKTKEFLRSKSLVLVNEGFMVTALEEACRQLRESGFMVWILEGGLNGWREAWAPLEGDPLAQEEVNKISSQAYFEEREYENRLAVDACRSSRPKETSLFPKIVRIASPENPREFALSLATFLKNQKVKAPLLLVIFNEDGTNYATLERAVRKVGIGNVFYLRDGLQGYKAFLEKRAALVGAEKLPKRTVTKCPSCP